MTDSTSACCWQSRVEQLEREMREFKELGSSPNERMMMVDTIAILSRRPTMEFVVAWKEQCRILDELRRRAQTSVGLRWHLEEAIVDAQEYDAAVRSLRDRARASKQETS
jgi:hypothetical protein